MACSVIMTCYNEGPYIEEAVRSILDQTRQDLVDRIVIADDGSAEATIVVLRQIEELDPRILILYGSGGLGLPGNRNAAAVYCTGEFLAFLDGDDIWAPTKLEEQCPVLETSPSVGLVYSGYYTFPDGALNAARKARVLDISESRGGAAGALTRRYFLNDPPIIPSTVIVRRDLFEAVGQFDASIRVFEDTDFFLRMSKLCSFAMVHNPLLYKRNHSASITGGRTDLMAHHARVAFNFAVSDPAMLTLVPRRLAERARKLGNQRFLARDREGALRLLRLATKLDVWNGRAWGSLFVAKFLSRPVERLLRKSLTARRSAMGESK
ncbi:glycosyltransferase family 2 protein [Sphingomonas sp. BIUV-7]|uniref:Glycosyltransferase family 2 protein n=1 Tax=Sphingomonas natans TaxID=3063330 RepID=A0ABT8YCL8_9SPHN|nr:glycosyltransferase family 2 protein [Sphingomonas sp. BIUV-7]MDO6416066.1 glycosyltransferase family 2 protein [Sphingomonas sp. BIUV-7]